MSDNIQKIFTSNLNNLLYQNGKTQLELAKYMGVSNTTVNNWSKGYNTPRMDKIDKICAFFNVQREDLLTEQRISMSDEKQKKIFSKNLNSYLEKYQKTQCEVAESIGVSPQTFNTWCQGIALPRMGKLQRLADYFHIEKSNLIDEHSEAKASNSSRTPAINGVRIPVLGRVAAGIPINAVEEILDWEEIPEDMARQGEFFGLSIRGDSMSPRIMNGDVVIVRRQDDADTGDIVIAIVNGDDGCCKKLKKHPDGITLISLNPAYSPMVFTKTEIDDVPVRIIGKVVELRGKF